MPSGLSDGATGQQPSGNPIIAAYTGWASSKPFVTRCVCIWLVIFFILGMIVPNLETVLNNNLHSTIFKFEIYRLITSNMWCTGLLNLVFALLTFNQMGTKLEYNGGSARLLALMGTLDLCSNIAFLAVYAIFSAMGNQKAEETSAQGFWNILMPLIAIECMQLPDAPRKLFFFPCNIPSRYYPLALFGLFSLFAGIRVDMGLSLLTGYAFALGKLDFMKPSNARVQGWDEGIFRNFSTRQGYVLAGSSQEPWIPLNNPTQHLDTSSRDSSNVSTLFGRNQPGQGDSGPPDSAKKPGTKAFAGTGQTLGGVVQNASTGRVLGRSSSTDPKISTRALRLAALESRGVSSTMGVPNSTGISNNSETNTNPEVSRESGIHPNSSLLASTDHEVMMLQDMGYGAEESREALRYSNGDINAAVTYLAESQTA